MMRARLAVGVLLATLQLPVVTAQSPNLGGIWTVEAKAAEVQTGDGKNWRLNALTGTLTLEQKGNAVTGTWEGRMPTPWKVTGKLEKNSFELQTEVRNIPAERDGEKITIARSWIFRGSINGDNLSGMFILAGGEGEPPGQPFTATRKK